MTLPVKPYITPEEYLALERVSETKNEYYKGEIRLLHRDDRRNDTPEEVNRHDLLVQNLYEEVMRQLSRFDVSVNGSVLATHSAENYLQADLLVSWSKTPSRDVSTGSTSNPILIAEVLSPSSEAQDRGNKFSHYQKIPSLQEYLLVSLDEPQVELFTRQEGDRWLYRTVQGIDGSLELLSLGCRILFSEVYNRIELPEDETPHPTE